MIWTPKNLAGDQASRQKLGLTQEVLAQKVDLTGKYLSAIESGCKIPKLNTFVSLANVLGVDSNTLLGEDLDVSPKFESNVLWAELADLPSSEQKRILHMFQLIVKDAKSKIE